jgi:2-alkyl-3-oxoalkanoate reductase
LKQVRGAPGVRGFDLSPRHRYYRPVRIFLTGGTGLIGSHVAEQLRGRGDDVVALVRPTSGRGHLESLGCVLVEGDVLAPPDELAVLMRGCDAVVHGAAKVFERGRRREFVRQNVEGTESVLRAAGRAAPRVVHLSSVAVYSGLRHASLTEDRWTEADPDRQVAYAASKHLSERAAWRLHEAGEVRLTTLRPSVVYGERDRAAAPIIFAVSRLPVVPIIGGGRATLPLVYAGNVARAVLAALDRDVAVGRAYNVAIDHAVTLRELMGLIAELRGRPMRTVSLPALPLRIQAGVVDGLTRLVPFLPGTDLGRAVRSMTRDNPYDSSRARLELGWTNLITHREGLRRTIDWWLAGEEGAG